MKQKSVVGRRISVRVACLLAVVAAVIGGMACAIQIAGDWRDERDRLDEVTGIIVSTAVNPASRAVQTLDDVLAEDVVRGLTGHPFVLLAQIADERGDILAVRTRSAAADASDWLSWLPVSVSVRHIQAPLPVPGAPLNMAGRLRVEISERVFFAPFLERTVHTAGLELVNAFLFALAAFLVLRRAVTEPLFRLAAWFGAIDPENPADVPAPVPLGDRNNELGLLARAGDAFRRSISSLLVERARYQHELEHSRDRLEGLVQERTRALASEIEDRKAIQQALQEANENLEAMVAERTARLSESMEDALSANAVKTVFLANMSHELRTPLNSIIGFSQMMAAEMLGPMPEQYKEYTDIVVRSGEHLLRLIGDVLDMSKIETGRISLRKEGLDPALLAREVVEMVSEQARANGVQVDCQYRHCDEIAADPTRIKQVVLNILSNAIKFSPNGRVEVEVGGTRAHCRIVVRDTGIGMNPEDIEVALLPFGQAERNSLQRRFQGTGLGLPIAKRLVELHGGSLSIRSEPGEGTEVTVLLPQAERATRRSAL